MNVTVMQQPRAEAERLRRQYERELARAGDDELTRVLIGLEAMADGWPVVSLSRAISQGGHDHMNRPNLAVARADQRTVAMRDRRKRGRWWPGDDRRLWFDAWREPGDVAPDDYEGLLLVDVNVTWEPGFGRFDSWVADVPIIPPGPRRKAGGKTYLRDHLVLWEVEEWRALHDAPVPPVDPMLLRPLGGDMYAVVAQWDLTELERAVMASRID